MKKIFCIAVTSLIVFAACGTTDSAPVYEPLDDFCPEAIAASENLDEEEAPIADLALEDDPYYTDGPRMYSTLWVGTMNLLSSDVPRQFSDLALANDVFVRINLATQGWATLYQLEEMLLERLEGDRFFDYVVLAELPFRYLFETDEFMYDALRLSEVVFETGATPVFFTSPLNFGEGPYMWPAEYIPALTDHATEVFQNLAEQSGAIFIDVSRAWVDTYTENPELELFTPAGAKSRKGAYFTACILLAQLIDLQVTEMPEMNLYVYDGEFAQMLALEAWEIVN